MTPENFCYWLRGLAELSDQKTLNEEQFNTLKRHLELVFDNVTKVESFRKELKDLPKLPPSNIPLPGNEKDIIPPFEVRAHWLYRPETIRVC